MVTVTKQPNEQKVRGRLPIWSALPLALVPIAIRGASSYRGDALYMGLAGVFFRSLPFIETSIFALCLWAFIRCSSREQFFGRFGWIALFAMGTIAGLALVDFYGQNSGARNSFFYAAIVLTNCVAAIAFGLFFRLLPRLLRRR